MGVPDPADIELVIALCIAVFVLLGAVLLRHVRTVQARTDAARAANKPSAEQVAAHLAADAARMAADGLVSDGPGFVRRLADEPTRRAA